jgi:hypothetical protein
MENCIYEQKRQKEGLQPFRVEVLGEAVSA